MRRYTLLTTTTPAGSLRYSWFTARMGGAVIACILALGSFDPAAAAQARVSSIDAAVSAALDRATMQVATFAGSSDVGNADGANGAASFTQPAGLLWDQPTKSLYVTDFAGQRIRRCANGSTSTVAGGGPLDRTHGIVPGGYVDGPAASARFDGPMGMAIDKTGALLVADSANGVIRRIAGGQVTTFAGRRGDDAGTDGPLGVGSFHHPMALSFASDGSLYVADLGVGVRRLAPDGTLSTFARAPDVSGVSVGRGPAHEVVWFGTFGGLHRIDLATKHEDARGKDSDASSTKARIGEVFQIVAVDDVSAIYSDLSTNTVRYSHEPDGFVGALNSDDSGTASESGSFRDGPSLEAKAAAPMGVALLPGDRVAFADSGDGRVRTISNFSTRGFSTDDPAAVPHARDPMVERIAVVGDSYAFTNVVWNDSLSGILENGLNATTPPRGKKRFVVDAFRLAGSRFVSQSEFIANYLGGYDGVIFLDTDFSLGASDKLDKADFVAPDYGKVTQALVAAAATLKENGTFLYVLAEPLAFETVPWERSLARLENAYYATRPGDYEQLLAAAERSGVRVVDARPTVLRLERSPNRQELFSPEDWHYSRAGTLAVGSYLLRSLLLTKPWSSP